MVVLVKELNLALLKENTQRKLVYLEELKKQNKQKKIQSGLGTTNLNQSEFKDERENTHTTMTPNYELAKKGDNVV